MARSPSLLMKTFWLGRTGTLFLYQLTVGLGGPSALQVKVTLPWRGTTWSLGRSTKRGATVQKSGIFKIGVILKGTHHKIMGKVFK